VLNEQLTGDLHRWYSGLIHTPDRQALAAKEHRLVARRLLAESVALVFAVREPSEERELAGLPELVVGGLSDDDARALLDAAIPGAAGRTGAGPDRRRDAR
jgi:hypothetical protein